MSKKIFFLTILLGCGQLIFAQSQIPMVKANSKEIKILDGDDLRDGMLVPSLRPDIYTYHKTKKTKTVTYYTDIDSISFEVKLGDVYDFGIVLNNKDTCFQQITSTNPEKISYINKSKENKPSIDTIPFQLGADDLIHIKGTINNSQPLDLIFDTGASVMVLSDKGKDKNVKLNDGNTNDFEIQNLIWNNTYIRYIDYNGGLKADGVIGYNAFEDKIVAIDYDKSILTIHDSLPKIGNDHSPLEMIWRGSATFIQGTINDGNKKYNGLLLFDTGSIWALSLTKSFSSENQLYGKMIKTGTRRAKGVDGNTIKSNTVILPQLELGDLQLSNIPIDLESPSDNTGLAFNILGNDVLKRFNVILDYQNGIIYLQTNSLIDLPYKKSFDENTILVTVIVLSVITVLGIYYYRKRKKIRNAGCNNI
ncbi:MAG: hypothetical protein R2819_15165 [Allomuricauda sp.]